MAAMKVDGRVKAIIDGIKPGKDAQLNLSAARRVASLIGSSRAKQAIADAGKAQLVAKARRMVAQNV